MIEELVGRAFAARNQAHVRHLTTTSYAEHMALGAFYESVIPAVDALVECYQGHIAPLGDIEIPATGEVKNISNYLSEEADWIEANREAISQGSDHLGNLVDNITAIYTRCVYMLRLK